MGLGNVGSADDVDVLTRALGDDESLVRERPAAESDDAVLLDIRTARSKLGS